GMDVLVPIERGESQVDAIVEALEAHDPVGGTPTADALDLALQYFTEGDGRSLEGNRYVLLATDGGPNCNDDITCDEDDCTINREDPSATEGCGGSCCEPDRAGPTSCLDEDRSVMQVEALAAAGIKTIVVGIPGTEFFADTLDALAEAGDAPNPEAPPSYYRVTAEEGAEGLTETLTRITTGLITSCRLQLTSTPDDPNYEGLLNVVIDGKEVPQAGDDGWDVDRATEPPTIVLKGETCEAMETQGASQVTVTYGCPTVVVPR
ncbi:MAG TPA: vWA domain-containing protein, partial [Polyangiaceae bacterium]